MKSLHVACLFAFALLFSLPASSEETFGTCGLRSVVNASGDRLSWNQSIPIKLRIHESMPSEFISKIKSAIQTWHTAAGRTIFEFDGIENGPAIAKKDGISVIYYFTEWESAKNSEQERITIYFQDDLVVEGDIRINGKDFRFSNGTFVESDSYDFEGLITHSLGHLLGFGHSPAKDSVMHETLSPGTLRREFGDSDCVSSSL